MTPRTESEAVVFFRPYVIKTAKYFKTGSVSEDDLIQEGLIAVALAFRKWSKDGGANFLTWIRRPVYYAMLSVVREHKRAGGSFHNTNRGPVEEREENVAILCSLDARSVSGRAGFDDEKLHTQHDRSETMHDRIGGFDEPPDWLALERLPEMLAALEPRERKAIRLRFEDGMSHAAVGRKLKVSRELARQIEAKALGKLKAMMSKGDVEA